MESQCCCWVFVLNNCFPDAVVKGENYLSLFSEEWHHQRKNIALCNKQYEPPSISKWLTCFVFHKKHELRKSIHRHQDEGGVKKMKEVDNTSSTLKIVDDR